MKDIIVKFHPRHVLEEFDPNIPNSKYRELCILCEKWIFFRTSSAYYCPICKFYFHEECATILMESSFTINRPKTHEHTLTFIRKENAFLCDACGVPGWYVVRPKMNMYGCLSCDFFVHKDCMYLPKVIKITRHSHRLCHTFEIYGGDMTCQYCSRELVCGYGGYTCIDKKCDYKLHSDCTTVMNLWDGKDVESELEEASTSETVAPPLLEDIDGKTIRHYSHEHDLMRLRVNDEEKDGWVCQACILPIDFDSFLCCKECDFALHDTCAVLPRKMDHPLHFHPLILEVDMVKNKQGFFTCSKCERESSGFMYRCCQEECGFKMDAKCASLTNPFYHLFHQHHPLFLLNTYATCNTCHRFSLDFKSATLPVVVKCKYDIHPLTLCRCDSTSERGYYLFSFELWCDICETTLKEGTLFYICADCDTFVHIECLIGKYPFLKHGHKITVNGFEIQISNNGFSRPICDACHCICQDKLVFINERNGVRFCSLNCINSSTKAIGNLMLGG